MPSSREGDVSLPVKSQMDSRRPTPCLVGISRRRHRRFHLRVGKGLAFHLCSFVSADEMRTDNAVTVAEISSVCRSNRSGSVS